MTVRRALPLLASTALLLTGCAGQSQPPHDPPAGPQLPPVGAQLDYQLGGAYDPTKGVEIVARDRTAASVNDLYSVCYVNGFQTQPGELDTWPDDLLLRDDDDEPVIDPDWPDEVILDTRKADEIAKIVGPWIRDCASDGFDAVEFDNLDTYTRTDGALSRDDALNLATLLVDTAHDVGLAAGQKNAAEDASLLHSRAGFDFAVVEECAAYEECSAYTEVYGDHVLAIEYADNLPRPWDEVCADPDTPASVVLRDRDLVTPDDPAYVFETCE
ncbi:endo alpha-1,4 polygalactosaminidase [Microbacterium sp. EYE_5]|uniref:endo alpha-1,4 polygalactosaminidase n=1 Tax=unclassified Microbacterium TaxID=2609290 RepID=UPI00200673CC|nr:MULTISPECIES: endo alpha-1,4 polygalactosaminidase [unclassified Microbacterium]MCK6081301.1 endo alpha-1,4 polygalactosaminidase [Microbacterium sp. EYE_382]MCK6086571.1 endo alpha-1,4 polygalactosaminidase [Microbacterium sp. EYE_384]MCK6123931.1 endo alpha-1,4 polygalactosaminidase [Microbacterium sp. EYE_80]MCK6126840.1 endo alpha-1,4 polygalactosaminidase [Microbacterium sp. EYE_79]MCK6142256.1 endo alpha-1,4 polygalactosaminidase [Microbacterium sp. EYE_39]